MATGLQTVPGIALSAVGVASLAGVFGVLADFAYAIVWWGVLLLADTWNWRRHGLSLWRGNLGRFLLITVPVSVLVWLFFEVLNLPAPQWRYRGGIEQLWAQVLFGFVAFATVLPIMIESWWLVAGGECLPGRIVAWFSRHQRLVFTAAALLVVLPFVNEVFWLNQGMWLVPALVLLPLLRVQDCPAGHAFRALALSGLLAGFAWEAFNYRASTHWEYLIMPDVPHLFYMPLPGYLGFIPFALSTLAVYEWQKILSLWISPVLYAAALGGLYLMTLLYIEHGLWVSSG